MGSKFTHYCFGLILLFLLAETRFFLWWVLGGDIGILPPETTPFSGELVGLCNDREVGTGRVIIGTRVRISRWEMMGPFSAQGRPDCSTTADRVRLKPLYLLSFLLLHYYVIVIPGSIVCVLRPPPPPPPSCLNNAATVIAARDADYAIIAFVIIIPRCRSSTTTPSLA